jgi:hypothetical protein
MRQTRTAGLYDRAQSFRSRLIRDIRRRHDRIDQEPFGIDQQMPFAAFDCTLTFFSPS